MSRFSLLACFGKEAKKMRRTRVGGIIRILLTLSGFLGTRQSGLLKWSLVELKVSKQASKQAPRTKKETRVWVKFFLLGQLLELV